MQILELRRALRPGSSRGRCSICPSCSGHYHHPGQRWPQVGQECGYQKCKISCSSASPPGCPIARAACSQRTQHHQNGYQQAVLDKFINEGSSTLHLLLSQVPQVARQAPPRAVNIHAAVGGDAVHLDVHEAVGGVLRRVFSCISICLRPARADAQQRQPLNARLRVSDVDSAAVYVIPLRLIRACLLQSVSRLDARLLRKNSNLFLCQSLHVALIAACRLQFADGSLTSVIFVVNVAQYS